MKINALATEKGLRSLSDDIKNRVKRFILIGDDSADNNALEELLERYDVDFEDVEGYIVFNGEAHGAYYDGDGVLTYNLKLPYEKNLSKYVYGIGLVDLDGVLVSVSQTPKFIKTEGIGSTFTYKIAATRGVAGEIIFDESEGLLFASDSEYLDGITRNKAIDPFQLKRANVAQAEKLEHGRKINGVEFDGTMDITVSDNTKLALAGGIMTGDIAYDKGTGPRVPVKVLAGDASGDNVLIEAGNLMVIGGGEFPNTYCRYTYPNGVISAADEHLVVGADENVKMVSGTQNWNSRKELTFDKSGSLRPEINNTLSLGTASHKWKDAHINNVHGTATNAVKLNTPRKINGVEFDGTKDITVTARANGGNADTLNGKTMEQHIATKAEAEAGTDNTKLMTPYLTAYSANQAISKKIIKGYTKTIPISALRAELAALYKKRMEGDLVLNVQEGETDDEIWLESFDCKGRITIRGDSRETCKVKKLRFVGVNCTISDINSFTVTSTAGNSVECVTSHIALNNITVNGGSKSTSNNVGFFIGSGKAELFNCIVSNKADAISGWHSTIDVRGTTGTNNENAYVSNGGMVHVGYDSSVEGQINYYNGGIVATPTSIVKSPVGGFWQILRFGNGIQPVLPDGGTWAWMNFQKGSLTSGNIDYVTAGVNAGGTALRYNPDYANFLFCWRVV